jgi:hypothetical protein
VIRLVRPILFSWGIISGFDENPVVQMRLIAISCLLAAFSVAHGDELPDWSGVWQRVEGNAGMFDVATTVPPDGRAGTPGVRQHPPLTDAWETKYQANLALVDKSLLPDPISRCGTSAGFPRLLALPDVYEFIVRPEQTWIITENGPNILRVYTDGRKHFSAEDSWPTFTGDSVGKWNGDVLEFTTINMVGEHGTVLDRSGMILSDQAVVHTKMFLTEEGLLRAELTIEDSVALTEAWHVARHFRRMPEGTRAFDYACAENNRNPITNSGQTLTLDTAGNVIDKEIRNE